MTDASPPEGLPQETATAYRPYPRCRNCRHWSRENIDTADLPVDVAADVVEALAVAKGVDDPLQISEKEIDAARALEPAASWGRCLLLAERDGGRANDEALACPVASDEGAENCALLTHAAFGCVQFAPERG